MNVTRPVFSYMVKSWGQAPKTVVCQYEGCGKTFCHSCHLYRHQRQKHGQQYKYKYNRTSWQAARVACSCQRSYFWGPRFSVICTISTCHIIQLCLCETENAKTTSAVIFHALPSSILCLQCFGVPSVL